MKNNDDNLIVFMEKLLDKVKTFGNEKAKV